MNSIAKIFLPIFGVSFIFLSCEKTSELSEKFSCDSSNKLHHLETVNDFNKNFNITIPKYWKTELYYDNIQSEIFTADTVKSLSDTYIMDFSMINSSLKINENLHHKIQNKNIENDLKTVEEYFHSFKNKQAFSNISKGKNKGMDFYVFQSYIKVSDDKYLLAKVEFYGKESYKTRLCEAISILNNINFIE